MKFYFNYKTHRQLAVTLGYLPKKVTRIQAAIAYTHDDLLINKCIENNIQLEWWGLVNHQNATSFEIIKKAISSATIKFYPFAELFHPKVIFFEDYGLYVGSANMTHSALYKNIEAGIFINYEDITKELEKEIIDFFNYLRENSILATIEDIDNINQFLDSTEIERNNVEMLSANIKEKFKEKLDHLFLLKPGLTDHGKNTNDTKIKKKTLFIQEWRETIKFLDIVKKVISENCTQPVWVNKDANLTFITDQLLHAFYYTYTLEGKKKDNDKKVQAAFNINKSNPNKAIIDAIAWWEKLQTPPDKEDIHINKWGKINPEILQKLKIRDLELNDFKIVMKQNHAALNHARQIPNNFFDLPADYHTDVDGRIDIFTTWLFKQKSVSGKTINDVIRYILFKDDESIVERIYNVLTDDDFKIERFGKSIVGELVGWGRPDITYLRNNRVNKALRCLGFDVRLFSSNIITP